MRSTGIAVWAVFVTCITASPLGRTHNPKSDVEDVPGLIFPNVINKICMRRTGYECRWTYEKSCSCNLVEHKKERILDVTFFRKIIRRAHSESAEMNNKCGDGEDKCIVMS